MQFLATWAKRLSWKEVAVTFRTTSEKVFRSVEWAVQWGLAHRDLSMISDNYIDRAMRKSYGFGPLELQKLFSVIRLAHYRSRNGPTDFADEAEKQAAVLVLGAAGA